MKRHQLPPRRLTVTNNIEWARRAWSISVGFDDALKVREIFADGHKSGTELEAILDDACILISMLLQAGASIQDLAEKLGREGVDPSAPASSIPSSILGLAIKRASEVEQAYGETA